MFSPRLGFVPPGMSDTILKSETKHEDYGTKQIKYLTKLYEVKNPEIISWPAFQKKKKKKTQKNIFGQEANYQ